MEGEDTYIFELMDDETRSLPAGESSETSLEKGAVFQLSEAE